MRQANPRKIQIYVDQNGREPFTEWLKSIRNRRTQKRIQTRIDRLEAGNLGDYRSVGDGVSELRFQFGPGYRVYFGESDNTIIVLLCGGDKSSQARDIEQAKTYWRAYKESQK